jgi:hypothetical protein
MPAAQDLEKEPPSPNPASSLPPQPYAGLGLPLLHQQALEQRLRESLGPMASRLLRHALAQTTDINELTQLLSQHLPTAQQAAFASEIHSLLQTYRYPSGQPIKIAQPQLTPTEAEPVSLEFINQCQTELTRWIGPMAAFLVQQTLKQYPQMTRPDFIQALASYISDPEALRHFHQKLQNK